MNRTTQRVPLLPETVKALSKKIHKFPRFIRKPQMTLQVLLNCSFAEDSISTCDIHSNDIGEVETFSSIAMEEEKSELGSSPSKTSPFSLSTISYTSALNNKAYAFSCFSEDILPIPEECRGKIVELTCDDDCMTDDEQVKGAIKKLHSSLQDSVTKRKQQETA